MQSAWRPSFRTWDAKLFSKSASRAGAKCSSVHRYFGASSPHRVGPRPVTVWPCCFDFPSANRGFARRLLDGPPKTIEPSKPLRNRAREAV
jgi:hypothetical protein